MRGSRTIPMLEMKVKPFSKEMLPRTSIFSSVMPSLHLYFVHCEDVEVYRQVIRNQIKEWTQLFLNKKDHEWLIIYIPNEGSNTKSKFVINIKASVLDKLKQDFCKLDKDKHRCVTLRMLDGDASDHNVWGDFFQKIKDGILSSFEAQVARFDNDIQRLDAQRMVPGWNFCQFFLLKQGLANCFEALSLLDDAHVQYEELEVVHFHTLHTQISSFSKFGGTDLGDDHPGQWLLATTQSSSDDESPHSPDGKSISSAGAVAPPKDYRALLLSNEISIFDFRIYLVWQQLHLLRKQRRVVDILYRAIEFIRAFSKLLVVNAPDLPPYFAVSFTLSFVEGLLDGVHSMLESLKLDDEALCKVNATKLELVLIAKAALDELGHQVYGMQTCMGGMSTSIMESPVETSERASDDKVKEIMQRLSYPVTLKMLHSKSQFAVTYSEYMKLGIELASTSLKPRISLLCKADLANLHFFLHDWHLASELYSEIVQTYAENGWLLVDRALLIRQAGCYRHLQNSKEYLMTCLRLSASNILNHQGFGTFSDNVGDTLEKEIIDTEQISHQARHLQDPVVVEFSPLFECYLPAISDSTVEDNQVVYTGLSIFSNLPVAMTMDRVSIAWVGGHTNDVTFSTPSSTTAVLLQPGINKFKLFWERPSTSGEYVAEKVKIDLGKLSFVSNLLKENRKHSLRLLEPATQLSIQCRLPQLITSENNQILVQLQYPEAIDICNCTLSLWSPPTMQILQVDVLSGNASPKELPNELVQHPELGRGEYRVPSFTQQTELLVRLNDVFDQLNLKVVLEYTVNEVQSIVSTLGHVVNSMPPKIHVALEVFDSLHYLICTISNLDAGELCVDGVEFQSSAAHELFGFEPTVWAAQYPSTSTAFSELVVFPMVS
jgi:uncharacterized protein YlbG (UPF0298 family)